MLQSIGDPLKTALKAVVVRSAARIDAIEVCDKINSHDSLTDEFLVQISR